MMDLIEERKFLRPKSAAVFGVQSFLCQFLVEGFLKLSQDKDPHRWHSVALLRQNEGE